MHVRRSVFVLFLCLIMSGGIVALRRYWRRSHTISAIEHQAHLDARIAELDWNDTSLQAAVADLCRSTGARIQVDPQVSIYARGPQGPLPLKYHAHLRRARLSTVLDILTDAAVTGRYNRATWDLRPDGTLCILPDPSAACTIKTYDISNLPTDRAGSNAAADPLQLAIRTASNQVPLPLLKSSGRWTFIGTMQEQAGIAAALDALHGPPGKLDQSDETANVLDRIVGPIQFHQAPLSAVIDTLADQAGVNVVVDWPGLPQILKMADPDMQVSIELERLPLRAAINLVLKHRMIFSASDNVLYVTPRVPPISFRQVRAYELSDLIESFAAQLQAIDARPGVSTHVASSDDYTDEAMDILKDLGQRSAPAGTGRFHGGYGQWLGGRLLVAAPADQHWELRRTFQRLRRFVQESAHHSPTEPRFLSSGQDVFALLNSPVKEIALDHTPLPTALRSLQRASGITIGFDAEFTQIDGQLANPVTLHLWDVPLSIALHQILKAASNATPLGYGIDQNVILVGNEPLLWSVTRIYDVSDIARECGPNQLLRLINGCTGTATSDPTRSVHVLQNLDAWLIVTQTPENHLRIESLLNALRNHGSVESGRLWPND